jgi:outer membrane murein-binding lipoprotein Lpp
MTPFAIPQAKSAPIPGLEQGTPSVPNRPAQPGAAGAATTQGAQPLTPQQAREQLRNQIRDGIRNGGEPQIIIPPNIMQDAVPKGAVDISVAFFAMIAVIVVGLPLARAFARRMDARSHALANGSSTLGPQIAQLQQSVDTMAIELERISEAQRFQSKLMAGKGESEPARLSR